MGTSIPSVFVAGDNCSDSGSVHLWSIPISVVLCIFLVEKCLLSVIVKCCIKVVFSGVILTPVFSNVVGIYCILVVVFNNSKYC